MEVCLERKDKMVYVIFGASGSGKTTLLEILNKEYSNISIHKKGTTRNRRQYDDEELEYYLNGLPTKYDYVYSQYGYEYGIEKAQINKAIIRSDNIWNSFQESATTQALWAARRVLPEHVLRLA